MTRLGSSLIFTFALLIGLPSTYAAEPPRPLALLSEIRFEQHIGQRLPLETVFKNEHDELRPLRSYFSGKPVILALAYFRCPNLCTLVLNGLAEALHGIPGVPGKDYQVLTISIDPSEKPRLALAKMRSYLAKLGLTDEPGNPSSSPWEFLTGTKENIQALAVSSGFHYRRDPLTGEFAHPSGILVLTPQGYISQYFFGIQFDPKKLHRSLENAALEKKGSWGEEILLYCFHYDPKLSRNGPLIMKAIRLTGALGALGVITFLAYLFSTRRKETFA